MRLARTLAGLGWVLASLTACGQTPAPASPQPVVTVPPSLRTTQAPPPTPTTPSPSLSPSPVLQQCQPFTDAAILRTLQSSLAFPYDDPLFDLNGAVVLPAGDAARSWQYVAARLGPVIGGGSTVGVWALLPSGEVRGVALRGENDGDQVFDSTASTEEVEEVFTTTPADTVLLENADATRVAQCVLEAEGRADVQRKMTLTQYQSLQPSVTTLKQLYGMVGQAVCEKSTESEIAGIRTVGLTCRGDGDDGANAILLFQDDVLISKAQAGIG